MLALEVIWAPVRTLERVAEERRVLPGFGAVAICTVLGLLNAIILVLGGVTRAQFEGSQFDFPQDALDSLVSASEIGTIVLSTISPFLTWIVVSLLIQLTTRFFGGSGSLFLMLAVVGVSFVPIALGAVLTEFTTAGQVLLGPGSAASIAIRYLGALLGFAFFFWQVALVVLGPRLRAGSATVSWRDLAPSRARVAWVL